VTWRVPNTVETCKCGAMISFMPTLIGVTEKMLRDFREAHVACRSLLEGDAVSGASVQTEVGPAGNEGRPSPSESDPDDTLEGRLHP
jgi:hypothetical protein